MTERRSIVQTVSTVRGGLTATAGVITAVLGVVFLLAPSWRPLPRDKIEATVTVAAVERDVGLLDWAQRQFPKDPEGRLRKLLGRTPTKDDDEAPGVVVYVRLHADGFKRRSISLRARVYDADTGRPPDSSDFTVLYPTSGTLKIDAPSRASVQLLMLDRFTAVPGNYFVRVEAYDDNGILSYDDSGPIKGDEPG